ncbi:MAG: Rrf2 family transcriptional regulator [Myxococcota bacterium]
MKFSAQEEYGLRCLLQVARRAPSAESDPLSIRDVADAEGLSLDYAAKLLRVLRQAGLITSERGATGGYRLARPADGIALSEVLSALDTPLYSPGFCDNHKGQLAACVHTSACSMRPVWRAIVGAVDRVLSKLYVSDLLAGERAVSDRVSESRVSESRVSEPGTVEG